MKQISFENIDLGGFWEAKQNTNRDVTMPVIYKQFYDSGRVTAFACDWKPGDEKKPFGFYENYFPKIPIKIRTSEKIKRKIPLD